MGRTKRKRLKNKIFTSKNCDNEKAIINLRKWLVQNRWKNESKLQLRIFLQTGRGVSSSKTVHENDILITIPYDLMITFTTLQNNLHEILSQSSVKLTIHDLLCLFLVIEKHKEKSLWKDYINSLPVNSPNLPWLGTSEELKLYPADLQIIAMKSRENFEKSICRLRESIKKHFDCVLDVDLFKWGYVLVNTRAVYVDPYVVRNMNDNNFLETILADEPTMALCPYLDMLNHHFLANTDAHLIYEEGSLVYQLKTRTKYTKYSEIFISYGAHDNIKLLMEYGFFIPGNIFDSVNFHLHEVLNVIRSTLNHRQYKFIIDHNFDKYDDLYIGHSGVSFKLKALLFISFSGEIKDFSSVIYSDSYTEHFLINLPGWIEKLLNFKLINFQSDYEKLKDCGFVKSENALIMESFLNYRIKFVSNLKNRFCIF